MQNWTPLEWSMFFGFAATFIASVAGSVAAVIRAGQAKDASEKNLSKIEHVHGAVQEAKESVRVNTEVTKAGIKVAARDNKVAVEAATEAKEAVANTTAVLEKRLNGELTKAIADEAGKLIEPVKVLLESAVVRIGETERYQHQSKHNLADALQAQNMKIQLGLEILRRAFPQHAGLVMEPPPGVKRPVAEPAKPPGQQ